MLDKYRYIHTHTHETKEKKVMNFRNSKGKVERKERNDVILISKKKK